MGICPGNGMKDIVVQRPAQLVVGNTGVLGKSGELGYEGIPEFFGTGYDSHVGVLGLPLG